MIRLAACVAAAAMLAACGLKGPLERPPPLWGDETQGPDYSVNSWYGHPADAQYVGLDPNDDQSHRSYVDIDNHGKSGANWVFVDGHADFLSESVHNTFFEGDNPDSPDPDYRADNAQSVNNIDPYRSWTTQTVD